MQERRKPLGMKNYGHIAHLPGSRMGPGDHSCELDQARIATLKARDRHDHIIVQEKLDGTNVGVARVDGFLFPLVRAGYVADTSPFEQHWRFAQWVYANQDRFLAVLRGGERSVTPTVIHRGGPLSVEAAMQALDTYGFHGALDPVEGAVWRVERNELINAGKNGNRHWIVDFLVKYVRPDKRDGAYLPEISGKNSVWNWR